MKTFFCFLFTLVIATTVNARSDGKVFASDFLITDTQGNQHNLYKYLNQGKSVVLNFSSTWCKPCWNYKESGALDLLWSNYGPDGRGEVVVLFLEADRNTCEECLYGQEDCNDFTYGNWASSDFPSIDLDFANKSIIDIYKVKRFPSIFAISAKDYTVEEVGQLSYDHWTRWIEKQRTEKEVQFAASNTSLATFRQAQNPFAVTANLKSELLKSSILKPLEVMHVPLRVDVYPNPCTEQINIQLNKIPEVPIITTLYNMNGAIVQEETLAPLSNKLVVSLGNIKGGTYLLMVNTGHRLHHEKILVVK